MMIRMVYAGAEKAEDDDNADAHDDDDDDDDSDDDADNGVLQCMYVL